MRHFRLLETREDFGSSSSSSSSSAFFSAKYQYVWSLRYIDAPVLRDTDPSGSLVRHYYTGDANFNVTALFNTSGSAVERYVYDPYGQVTIYNAIWSALQSPTLHNNSTLYTGQWHDSETGLSNYRERYYHALLGRFCSHDALIGMNLYLYVRGNPIRFVDPSGQVDWSTFAIPAPTGEQWGQSDASGYEHLPSIPFADDLLIGDFTNAVLVRLMNAIGAASTKEELERTNKTFRAASCRKLFSGGKHVAFRCGYLFAYRFRCNKCDKTMIQLVTKTKTYFDSTGKLIDAMSTKSQFVEGFAMDGNKSISKDSHLHAGVVFTSGRPFAKRCVSSSLKFCCGTYDGKTVSKRERYHKWADGTPEKIKCTSLQVEVTIKFCYDSKGTYSFSSTGTMAGNTNLTGP
jgi:RHS repeat-associated protein